MLFHRARDPLWVSIVRPLDGGKKSSTVGIFLCGSTCAGTQTHPGSYWWICLKSGDWQRAIFFPFRSSCYLDVGVPSKDWRAAGRSNIISTVIFKSFIFVFQLLLIFHHQNFARCSPFFSPVWTRCVYGSKLDTRQIGGSSSFKNDQNVRFSRPSILRHTYCIYSWEKMSYISSEHAHRTFIFVGEIHIIIHPCNRCSPRGFVCEIGNPQKSHILSSSSLWTRHFWVSFWGQDIPGPPHNRWRTWRRTSWQPRRSWAVSRWRSRRINSSTRRAGRRFSGW